MLSLDDRKRGQHKSKHDDREIEQLQKADGQAMLFVHGLSPSPPVEFNAFNGSMTRGE
jgi:hypothetical protein